jgi:hypothetical protein
MKKSLEDITLSEISQAQIVIHSKVSLMCGVQKVNVKEVERVGLPEMGRMVGGGGGGEKTVTSTG